MSAMHATAISRMLDQLGLAMGPHQVHLIDAHKAQEGYVHHTQTAVALAGYTLVSPEFAQSRFPKLTFIDLIQKRPSMDEIEACALAQVCGADVTPPFWGNGAPFGQHLWAVIERYQLDAFFERVGKRYGSEGDHYLMRPKGIDWNDPEQPELPDELRKWRSDYKKQPPERQLMVATILQLYKQGNDPYWMVRVPKKWHAAEGIEILRTHGALKDWAKLYSMYPGW